MPGWRPGRGRPPRRGRPCRRSRRSPPCRAPDVLTNRLGVFGDAGVMERRPYREPGTRTRHSYHLTPAGEQLRLVLAALQQWGDENRAPATGPTVLRRSAGAGRPARVAFVDDQNTVVPADDVRFTPAESAPQPWTPHGPRRTPRRLRHQHWRSGTVPQGRHDRPGPDRPDARPARINPAATSGERPGELIHVT
ncbi:winged helix-turn-helix transcriptional regulator [Streptomyces sp. NPDC001970]